MCGGGLRNWERKQVFGTMWAYTQNFIYPRIGWQGRVRVGVLDMYMSVYDLLSFSSDTSKCKSQNSLNMPQREQRQQEENYM